MCQEETSQTFTEGYNKKKFSGNTSNLPLLLSDKCTTSDFPAHLWQPLSPCFSKGSYTLKGPLASVQTCLQPSLMHHFPIQPPHSNVVYSDSLPMDPYRIYLIPPMKTCAVRSVHGQKQLTYRGVHICSCESKP